MTAPWATVVESGATCAQRAPEVRALWRRVLRLSKTMPKAQQDYYYSYARQNFISFSDEDDPERVGALIERGKEHINFIVKKYDLDQGSGGAHFDKQFWNSAATATAGARESTARATQPPTASEDAGVGEGRGGFRAKVQEEEGFGTGAGSQIAATQTPRVSRPLNGVVVEADVLGQLIVVEVGNALKVSATSGVEKIMAGDVLVEIDGLSVRGSEPASLKVTPGAHTYKFGRRTPEGPLYYSMRVGEQ
mmetsp:Transcript_1216/g.2035  ORF Transcript_1216/g.2035 Transcript_1216/m.2035 type:complete len:249 (+) Transcript_1216:1-747(+)